MPQINYTILKTPHETKKHAVAVAPYLPALDVASIELTFCPESTAKVYEAYFLLKNRNSKEPWLTKMREAIGDPTVPMSGFFSKLTDILVEKRIPVILLERLPNEESEIARKITYQDPLLETQRLLSGDLAYMCENLFEMYQISERRKDDRDQLMANNAKTIEKRIFELYPQLRRKEMIHYGIIIGADHKPETYLNQEGYNTAVIEVPYSREDNPPPVFQTIKKYFENGKTKDDTEIQDLLAIKALTSLKQVIIPGIHINEMNRMECNLIGKISYANVAAILRRFGQLADGTNSPTIAQQELIVRYIDGMANR